MKFYLIKKNRSDKTDIVLLKTWNSLESAMPFLQKADKKLRKSKYVFHNIYVSTYCKTESDYDDCGAKGLSWFSKDGFEFAIIREDSPIKIKNV